VIHHQLNNKHIFYRQLYEVVYLVQMLVENNHHYVTKYFYIIKKKTTTKNNIQIQDKIFQILNNVNIQYRLNFVLIEVLLNKHVRINFDVML